MSQLKDVYPLYLNNKAVQPNTDLAVTDKFTGEIAFRTALATPDVIDEAIAGAVRAADHERHVPCIITPARQTLRELTGGHRLAGLVEHDFHCATRHGGVDTLRFFFEYARGGAAAISPRLRRVRRGC